MVSDNQTPYPAVSSRADFPELEKKIFEWWEAHDIFTKSVEQREGSEEFIFNDGPPFANGLPHYGHILTGYVKDVIPRYQTMRGKKVSRVFGWDCHGLPAEMHTEKEIDVSGRKAITDYGIDKFNEYCRTSVLKYTDEWKNYVTRQARWVNFDNGYKTMDRDYMESVIWAFKQLWNKGLIYEANRVMPYSWKAETPLSNFEIRLDDATRPRQDPALTVGFELTPKDGDPQGPLRILAWTTTPWTLPSNLALAVGPDITYVAVLNPNGEGHLILAEAALAKYSKELGEEPTVVATFTDQDLQGRTYTPLFNYFASHPNAFQVLSADFVATGDGTGIVHLAPGFGEEDQKVCEANDIEMVVPVNDEGAYTQEVTDFVGQNVFEANPKVATHLKEQGVVLRHETYDHNYPHCWRTDEPIIYKAIPSWYVRVTDFSDRLQEINQEINWIPDHVKDGAFGKWLEGARDWSISRNRFWGAPVPIWRSDNPDYPRVDVYGSIDEIEADFGVRPDDLHRPYIDELVRPNPDDPSGKSMMRRVPEVLDCWFESGSMPFAQHHYPFDNSDLFERTNPADFIVEYIAQTRGWFYTMHVLSVALFDKPAFSNVICHGVVLDAKGQKLSKKLRNYPDPLEIFDSLGADALRWYLMSSPILRGLDLKIEKDAASVKDVVRQVMNPLWSAYSFFTLYANADNYQATYRTDSKNLLDRYILAKTRNLIADVQQSLDTYDLAGACDHIQGFLDALTNWYIRRSRARFWNTENPDADVDSDALDTLYSVLQLVCQVAAPMLPLVTETIWRGLASNTTGDNQPQSVHLANWPEVSQLTQDDALVEAMDQLRDAASAGLRLRDERKLRVRLPLASATIAGPSAAHIKPFADLLADELNVKEVIFTDDVQQYGSFALKPLGKVLGPKIGPDVQTVIKAAKAGEWEELDDGTVRVAGHVLEAGEFDLGLVPTDGVAAAALRGNHSVVVLDDVVTPELEIEGLARDLVRLIQQERKEQDLVVTDRIVISLTIDQPLRDAVAAHKEWIMSQVLATELHEIDSLEQHHSMGEHKLGLSFVVSS